MTHSKNRISCLLHFSPFMFVAFCTSNTLGGICFSGSLNILNIDVALNIGFDQRIQTNKQLENVNFLFFFELLIVQICNISEVWLLGKYASEVLRVKYFEYVVLLFVLQ